MKCIKLFSVLVSIFLLNILNVANAAIIWDWEILNNNQTVGATENVFLTGRLFNNSTNGEVFGVLGSGADWLFSGSSHQLITGYDLAQTSNLSTILNINLAAGDSVDFFVAEYVPQGVQPFVNYSGIISFSFSKENFVDLQGQQNCFDWNVGRVGEDSCSSHDVPEPTTIFFYGAALVGAFVRRKRLIHAD